MNPNGSRFHLLKEKSDWLACQEEGLTVVLRDSMNSATAKLAWDDISSSLILHQQLSLFRRRAGKQPLPPEALRGSAVDSNGNFFWIAADRQRIFWIPGADSQAQVYWQQNPVQPPAAAGAFTDATAADSKNLLLTGLTVTDRQYLVAGRDQGLLIFDLYKGGEPIWLDFPAGTDIHPLDLAAAADGGLWVLAGGAAPAFWQLDRHFCLLSATAQPPQAIAIQAGAFAAVYGAPVIAAKVQSIPQAVPIAANNPIAITALPDGSVLILDAPPAPAASIVWHYQQGNLQQSWPLQIPVDAVQLADGSNIQLLTITAHDFQFNPSDNSLYMVDAWGKQTIAFNLPTGSPPMPTVKLDYLPLHAYGGRGLVLRKPADATGVCTLYYDLDAGVGRDDSVRWAQLQALQNENRYQRQGALITRVFDGKQRDCLWDGLFLDACIPPGATVLISTRTHNEIDLVQTAPFLQEPPLYQRGLACEIPFYDPYQDINPRPDFAGTWEVLLQAAIGRYLQVRIELQGNAIVTPHLRALRVYYPRFSYVKNYLPAVYREDAESAGFLERLLANPQGFYTYIESRIVAVDQLFDPRNAPEEALDWLASWVGLALDPLWSELHKRQADGSIAQTSRPDRRRLFIRFAYRLFERRGTRQGMLLALNLFLNPCLEAMLDRLKIAAVGQDPVLRQELALLGLPTPTALMSDQDLEDLLNAYLLSPNRPAQIRIVERFMTRGGRGVTAGDLSGGATVPPTPDTASGAHVFSVLVPDGLGEQMMAMVGRIVDLEKPAHTTYDLRVYSTNFRIGEVRLGMDTLLGDSARYQPIQLGNQALADGYLEFAPPMNVSDRLILDRDYPGEAPPL